MLMATADALKSPQVDPLDVETPDGYELIDGALVEKAMSADTARIASRIHGRLFVHCEQTRAGEALVADAAYRCFPNRPRHARKPDASFIRRDRLATLPPGPGDFPFPPDLVVEVTSANESYSQTIAKVRDFRSVGVPLIWVID